MVLRTGTFFCDMTTAQLFPRTPTEVMFAAVMALKAYSAAPSRISLFCHRRGHEQGALTDLVEPALVREDGDVSVEAGAACTDTSMLAETEAGLRWLAFDASLPDMLKGFDWECAERSSRSCSRGDGITG